ncbi:MAG: TonB-dependent receptor [candidate division WOR-3 bacterium]
MGEYLILNLILFNILISQVPRERFEGKIKGTIIDKETNEPLEYASISLFREKDSTFIIGVLSDKNGEFLINVERPGIYFLRITFLGYEKREIHSLRITPENRILDIGKVYLEVSGILLKTQEVIAEPLPITYKVDKKVIEVSKMGFLSGNAVDILKNVPSVSVDIEGNVKLRGSENFLLYIDGRQSLLDPNDALKQIPASSIEKIEIITNPSARYEAEGTSGIINIILKKGKIEGLNGIINSSIGVNEKYGGDFILNYKKGKINTFISLNYNKRKFSEKINSEREINEKKINSDGSSSRIFNPFNIRTGIDLNIKEKNLFGVGLNYGIWNMQNRNFSEYNEIFDTQIINYKTEGYFKRKGPFFEIVLNDLQKFKKEEDKLFTEFVYSYREGNEENRTYKMDSLDMILNGNKRIEEGTSNRFSGRAEYTKSFKENFKFETGFRGEYGISKDMSNFYNYKDGNFEIVDSFCHSVKYLNNIQAIYSLLSGEFKNTGYQIGLRIEYNNRKIEYADTNLKYIFEKIDYFPTIHFSHRFLKLRETFLSYSRRISRPRDFWLEPLLTWMDPYNLRKGNPDLKPEYIDNFETGITTPFLKGSLTFETYYRITYNKFERIRIPYGDSAFLHTVINSGKLFSYGGEISFNKNIFKLMNMNLVLDFYGYKFKGKIYDEKITKGDINYNLRFNSNIFMPFSSRLQLIFVYHSPPVSAQGKEKEFITFDFSIQKFFLNKNLSLNLEVRNLFNTLKRGFEIKEENYKYIQTFKQESGVLILTMSYNFNNYKPERKIKKEIEEEREEFEY